MAAINNPSSSACAIVLAAMALPGLCDAQTLPEDGTLSVRLMGYRQVQSLDGDDQSMRISSPAFALSKPIDGKWLLEASLTHDNVSGASPRYHTSGASHMTDERTAVDVKATRYFDRYTLGVGLARSSEHDYTSNAGSLTASWWTEDKNTTLNIGLGVNRDRINPTNQVVVDESKDGTKINVGVTQVLSPVDLVQASYTRGQGDGYFSDPYKYLDARPRSRDEDILLLRWNHHLKSVDATTRATYRYYKDSFDIKAHTLRLEVVKPLADGWTITPGVRYYTQSQASFYVDAPLAANINQTKGAYHSADQRLAAMGSWALSLGVTKQINADWSASAQVEMYRQNASYRLGGDGSPGLTPLTATQLQIGLQKRW